jgi:predicted site-specific integrase-resolvase
MGELHGIDSEYMPLDANAENYRTLASNRESIVAPRSVRRAALYARVGTDAQQKEATIGSQLSALKRQIAADATHGLHRAKKAAMAAADSIAGN